MMGIKVALPLKYTLIAFIELEFSLMGTI